MAKNELKTASVLAFERKIDPSDAIFSSGNWDDRGQPSLQMAKAALDVELKEKGKVIKEADRKYTRLLQTKLLELEEALWPSIRVREKAIRGTISHRMPKNDVDVAKLNSKKEDANLQRVDVATLPSNADTLCARFTLRLLPGVGVPSACNNAAYQQKLKATIDSYTSDIGYAELARRYAANLANARFLWRNRMGAEAIEVQVRHLQQGEVSAAWSFDALAHPLRDFDTRSADLDALAQLIEQGLGGERHLLLEVVAFARMGQGQEVYPSQELILDRGNAKGGKSKTLYTVGEVAAMHSQKIGNALRTIDTWYPDPEGEGLGPIAIEPYGSVTSQGKAYRQPKQKMDFYTLLDGWVLHDKVPDTEQQHYVIANLIRGGVFGDSGKE